jgi:hypothetical protein
MDINDSQFSISATIGKCGGADVVHSRTHGGLHLVWVAGRGKPRIIAAAPHKYVAKCLAEENEPDIQWSELSKGEYIERQDFEHLLPEYRALTARFNNEE